MAKLNRRKKPLESNSINLMGEKAFKFSTIEELITATTTTFLSDSYYETESERVQRILKGIDELADPLFSAKLALYLRKSANLRSVSHLIAAYLAKDISGTIWGKNFYNDIVVRPDDMAEIIAYYSHINGLDNISLKKIPAAMKRGFKKALENLDAYQIDKYKMKNSEISLIDLVNLFHPKPTDKNREAYKRLMNGEKLDDLYTSNILGNELSKAGQVAESEDELKKLNGEIFKNMLFSDKGMPIMNLLRNLRNILKYASDETIEEACRQLTIEDKIINSKQLPFRFATAYEEVEKMKNTNINELISFESETINVNNIDKILEALEKAIEISCYNIPFLEGNTAILIDHSGSVRGDYGGSSKVSAFSTVSTAMIGNLFASMVAFKQKDIYIGLFGDKLVPVPIKRNMGILGFNKYSFDLGANCGPSTEQGIYDFLNEVINKKKNIDNLIIFSDMQIGSNGSSKWYGIESGTESYNFPKLFREFKKVNPSSNVISVNIQAHKDTVFHPEYNITNISGWSNNIFNIIENKTKGIKGMVKEINSIQL